MALGSTSGSLTRYMTLGTLLNISGPQLPHLYEGVEEVEREVDRLEREEWVYN